MAECYNCGDTSYYRDVKQMNVVYVDGSLDTTHDEYCVRCGTMLYGEIKRA